MSTTWSRRIAAPALLAVMVAMAGTSGASVATAVAPAAGTAPARGADAWKIRAIPTSEYGVRRPTGVAWDPGRGTLMVTGAGSNGGTRLIGVSPADDGRGRAVVRSLDGGSTAAERLAVRPAGSTYSPDGTWHVLDAAGNTLVSVTPAGHVERVRLRGLDGVALRGLAYQPVERRLYVADASARHLYALDASGAVVRTQSLSGAEVADLQAMTFAPSADPTDARTEQSLFIADAGNSRVLGSIAEVSLDARVAAPTAAPRVASTLVGTVSTAGWNPASPDPSGIVYLPDADRLLTSDGEVEEMAIYAGANLFTHRLDGTLEGSGTSSPAWSNEPTGLGFNPGNGHLFVSDDSAHAIFEIDGPGSDGTFGTADDGTRTKFRTVPFGSHDPEGVDYDTSRDQVLIIDGLGEELYRVDPGANDRFDGVPPGGDDTVTHTDMTQFGIVDPEGIAYDAERDAVLVLDKTAIWELDEHGSLLDSISLAGVPVNKAAGLAIGPASDGSGATSYYVVDRGVDNDAHPTENDGKLYEIAAGLPAPGDPPRDDTPDLVAKLIRSHVPLGTGTAIPVTISPAVAGQQLRLQRWNGTGWPTVQTIVTQKGKQGYRFTVTPTRTGLFKYRVVAAAFAGRARIVAPGADKALVLRVYRAAVTRVLPSGKESVTVRNTGTVSIPLAGWTLRNARTGHGVTLPTFNLGAGRVVRIHTGAGSTDRDDLYLGRRSMWGAHGTAVLRDLFHGLADRFGY